MTKRIPIAVAAISLLALTTPVLAQEGITLPEICTSGAMDHDTGTMKYEPMQGMDQAHQDLMKGMDEMNSQMMKGMIASDIDVAFVCGMIPHHQGAINMAKAELAHGDDQWAKDMAQKVVDAQEKEIAEMIAWLEEQPKP